MLKNTTNTGKNRGKYEQINSKKRFEWTEQRMDIIKNVTGKLL